MAETSLKHFIPETVNPIRHDPPGTVTAMPSPTKMHHVHIFSDVNYDVMVDFYQRLFDAETIAVHDGPGPPLTFLSYDDHDHRVVVIKKPGWGTKSEHPVGVSHLAYGYASLGELVYIYKRMKEWGYAPHWTVNHGNSTSFYYRDPDGNEVETMLDNFAPIDAQTYKRNYQFSEEFGAMSEGNFDPDKMVALYESGVPEAVLLAREEVRKMVKDGTL